MDNFISEFIEDKKHPNQKLCSLYLKHGGQGNSIKESKIIFFGLDANFKTIDESNVSFFEENVFPYISNFNHFLEKHNYSIHHTFLLPDYQKGAGYRYHYFYNKLASLLENEKNRKEFITNTSFCELIYFPTFNITSNDYKKLLQSEQVIEKIDEHLFSIFDQSNSPKIVFFAPKVLTELKNANIFNKLRFKFPKLLQNYNKNKEELKYKEIQIGIHTISVCYHLSATQITSNNFNLLKQQSKIISSHLSRSSCLNELLF